MNTIAAVQKNRTHPMLIVASCAVMLVSLTGTAALMGWLPNSNGAGVGSDAPASMPSAAVPRVASHVAQRPAATAPVAHSQSHVQPTHHAAAPVCQSCGIVESVREVSVRGDSNGLGAAGGAVVGGLLGNQVGSGHGRQAMTVAGAIGGAFAGNQIEKRARGSMSYETTVHMNDGSSRTIAQSAQPEWHDGDRVKIVDGVVRFNG